MLDSTRLPERLIAVVDGDHDGFCVAARRIDRCVRGVDRGFRLAPIAIAGSVRIRAGDDSGRRARSRRRRCHRRCAGSAAGREGHGDDGCGGTIRVVERPARSSDAVRLHRRFHPGEAHRGGRREPDRRPHHPAQRGHGHLHRRAHRQRRAVPRTGARRSGAADGRQRRHPESPEPRDQRSDARRPGVAGRDDRRRFQERIRRARQRIRSSRRSRSTGCRPIFSFTPSGRSRTAGRWR